MNVYRVYLLRVRVFGCKYSRKWVDFPLFSRHESSSSSLSPLAKYELKIAEGKLTNDEFQRKIVTKLQIVYDDIQGYKPPSRGLISKFLRLNTSANVPKGLYLYGAVGGGKTMLMDLFFSCCKASTNPTSCRFCRTRS